jgi:hypothetical protein
MEPTEGEIVDSHRLDYLYTHAFRDGAGKFFTVVSVDEGGLPVEVEALHPSPSLRTKIKTTLTFIRSPQGGEIRQIEFKRFQNYVKKGWVVQVECIKFSFPFFVGLVGFLQGLAGFDLDSLNERRIPLADTPTLDAETKARFRTFMATDEGQAIVREAMRQGDITKADLVNIGYRKAQLAIFESFLGDPTAIHRYMRTHDLSGGVEGAWQHFFEANTWIFGYGLDFVFNQPLEGKRLEQTVSGFDVAGYGKRTDGLLKSTGLVNSLCLVEIKTPEAALLEGTPSYRVDCWRASKELSGASHRRRKPYRRRLKISILVP